MQQYRHHIRHRPLAGRQRPDGDQHEHRDPADAHGQRRPVIAAAAPPQRLQIGGVHRIGDRLDAGEQHVGWPRRPRHRRQGPVEDAPGDQGGQQQDADEAYEQGAPLDAVALDARAGNGAKLVGGQQCEQDEHGQLHEQLLEAGRQLLVIGDAGAGGVGGAVVVGRQPRANAGGTDVGPVPGGQRQHGGRECG